MKAPNSFVGVDIGGTHIKLMAVAPDGQILAEQNLATLDDGSPSWLKRACGAIADLLAKCPAPARVGIAAPGLPSANGRSIACMPGRLAGIENLDWQSQLGLETPVPVFNDAQAALLGEVWLGAAKGIANVMLFTVGTGVGGGAMVDGRILRGHLGRAGHLGHVSLNPEGPGDVANTPGSLEDLIGEHTLKARSGGLFRTTRELVTAYQNGSKEAAEIWLRSVKGLAAAIAGLINVLDPEVVIIGGGIAAAGDALFKPLQAALDQFEWRPGGSGVRLVKAELGSNAGAIGAAHGARIATTPLGVNIHL